jgi:hypothetical protein
MGSGALSLAISSTSSGEFRRHSNAIHVAIRVAIRVAISGDLEELLAHQILGLTNPLLRA